MTLITKYRPATFAEVIGQDGIIRSLKANLAKKSSHAFLFAGPSGCGKTTLARIVATELGCEGHDLQEIDAATFTGIDDMRAITQALQYRPLGEGKIKCILIDECHALSKAAWQSLLKSIEEPPAWVYWFFCTTDPARVPETIKSRCSKYELKEVPSATLTDWLLEIATEEGSPPAEAIIELCAREAKGSPRAALSNLAACQGAKSKDEAATLLKSVLESSEAVELARALVGNKPWFAIQEILRGLKDQNPENVRHVVRAYVTTILLSSPKQSEQLFAILEAFGKPFPSGDGISPVLLACGSLLFGG